MNKGSGTTAKGNSPYDTACYLAEKYPTIEELNEADTRHQVIDSILHDVLSWPRSAVHCESFIDPGFADYMLLGRRDNLLLLIEAKKEGKHLAFPASFDKMRPSSTVRMRTLLTDEVVRAAVEQVRAYCTNVGCEYAAITNGHQWVFFKIFERQRDWRDLNAFVIHGLHYFRDCFVGATNKLGYLAITERAGLVQLLGTIQAHQREVFSTRTKIPAYNQEVNSNHLAPFLRPLAMRYLAAMDERDDEFMEACYVNLREYNMNVEGVNQVIRDRLSPYFIGYNVKEFVDDSDGGDFGARLLDNLAGRRRGEVIVLFGGKGSGKSTFIRRLLYHRPPEVISAFAVVAVVDLLKCPEERAHIEDQIWKQLLTDIDQDNVLTGERAGVLQLCADKYEQAQRQFLVGLDKKSDNYHLQLNALIKEWLSDREYCAARLAEYWKEKQKGIVIVLDNTDQFSTEMQDYCFTLAQHISATLDCLVVISMREERFYYSKLHGTLDAFPNSGFHLSSPPTQEVFYKRLAFMNKVLDRPKMAQMICPGLNKEQTGDIKKLLLVLRAQFKRGESSHLNEFLAACGHGNMRLSLELFREFLLSGYTRVDEMIRQGGWTLTVHQVLRPMMVPYRFFYKEESSNIPNLYQIRSELSGSHFTALRILGLLSANALATTPVYLPLSQLKAYFGNTFNMIDDLVKNLDILLRTGLVESNNRVDEYAESIDSLKITPFGHYMMNIMCFMFSYLDLVCLDCGVHEEAIAHSLARSADKDIDLFFKGRKLDRVEIRMKRAEEFVEYLVKEEENERDFYGLDGREVKFGAMLKDRLAQEKVEILRSARRNYTKDPSGETPDVKTS